jgi:hypothetical protein
MLAIMGIRLIVTGSRDYPAERSAIIRIVLAPYLLGVTPATAHGYILVHGDCPPRRNEDGGVIAGADYIASKYWAGAGGTCEPYPAEWAKKCGSSCYHKQTNNGNCPAQGPRRNQLMADLGADECLGFPWFDKFTRSSGTLDMMRRAHARGITTYQVGTTGTKELFTGAAPKAVPPMWPVKPRHDR